MNAKQAAKKAAKLTDEAANKDGKPFVKTGDTEREPLPKEYEKLYQSEFLKKQIADPDMWALIPAVSGEIQSKKGIQRLKENPACAICSGTANSILAETRSCRRKTYSPLQFR